MSTLKMGFAMGGGIALGTFSGAAMAQSIKLAILYAKDEHGHPFEKVEIDVFSGASAGAMSLGLMLRALVHQTQPQRDTAAAKLIKEFAGDFTNLPPSRKNALISAQVLQDIQYQTWVEDVNIEKLLQHKASGSDLTLDTTAGIFNRGIIDTIAAERFSLKGENINSEQARYLLAQRVLYGASLSNVTGIVHDARGQFNTVAGARQVLNDGMTSVVHKEMRIFDLYIDDTDKQHSLDLTDEPKHPSRWMRFHLGAHQQGKVGKLDAPHNEAWSIIGATAIASGAFPFAFEPVVLKRSMYEFGEATWPRELKDRNIHSAHFTYTDGGTFNNEPIREAFRLASFIDAHDERIDSQRWIVFVDPHITPSTTNFKVPVHQQYILDEPGWLGDADGFDLEKKNSLDRLLPHAFSLLSAVTTEARVIEGDKIFQVMKKFKLRKDIRTNIANGSQDDVSTVALKSLLDFIETMIDEDIKKDLIPAGGMSITAEVRRILREEPHLSVQAQDVEENLNAIRQLQDQIAHKKDWHSILSFIMVDLSMDLIGKSDRTRLVAIGPIQNPSNDPNVAPIPVDLPGGKLGAFGGFMHQAARHLDTELAKWCAHAYLHAANLIDQSHKPAVELPAWDDDQHKAYEQALENGTKMLLSRLTTMISGSELSYINWIPPKLVYWLSKSKVLEAALGEIKGNSFEFRIELNESIKDKFEFDGPGNLPWLSDQDIKAETINGRYYLITFLQLKEGTWSGPHYAQNKGVRIDQNAKGLLQLDKVYCYLNMPTPEQVKQATLMGYPIFETVLTGDSDTDTQPRQWHLKDLAQPLELKL